MDSLSFLILYNNFGYNIYSLINHYYNHDLLHEHKKIYKKILAKVIKATFYLRITFDEYQYDKSPDCEYRIGRFGYQWDTKSNYPGFYENYRQSKKDKK